MDTYILVALIAEAQALEEAKSASKSIYEPYSAIFEDSEIFDALFDTQDDLYDFNSISTKKNL